MGSEVVGSDATLLGAVGLRSEVWFWFWWLSWRVMVLDLCEEFSTHRSE